LNEDSEPISRCGFVALIGAPNAGKSTLLNQLVGRKVSIVTPKAQTTRSRVLGIAIEAGAQIIYVDTPGIFDPGRRLDRAMVRAAWSSAADADIVALLIDAKQGLNADAAAILERLERRSVLVLNKIDLVDRTALLDLADRINRSAAFERTFMISALANDGVDDLRAHFAAGLPAGPWLYPADQIADIPQRLLAAEITREKVFLQLHQEIPYQTAVETENWQERQDGSVRIDQVIYVARPNQKAIVLGRDGRRVKAIGTAARTELERLFERRVHLFIHVKVREKWAEDPDRFRDLGLDYEA